MSGENGRVKAKRFVDTVSKRVMDVDKRPAHDPEFCSAHEKQHSEVFKDYLGSCTRYLSNKRMKELKYHG